MDHSYLELQLSTSSQSSAVEGPSTEEHVETIERLLHSITRIRSERDGLRRDLEFLNVENKFAVQSLEAKLAAASVPVTPSINSTQFSQLSTLEGYIHILEGQAERTSRTTLALAIVAQRVAEQEEVKAARIHSLLDQLSSARESLQQSERRLQERQGAIESLETQLSSSTTSIGEAESQVAAFRTTIQRLEDELAKERHSHIETGAALSDAEAQLNDLSQTLTDAEAARDALALEKTHLEADLDAAREELADAEARHAAQLTNLATAGESGRGVQAVLRAQVGELQDRVTRRTQQIGEHQHDIKRLETNMRLQEERIVEMTAELDVAQSERAAMLEDCRTTREQRDEAMMRCDELEEAMEALEEAREIEVEAVVKVVFAAASARRKVVVQAKKAAAGDRVALEERIRVVEQEKDGLASRLEALVTESNQLAQMAEHELASARGQLEEASSTVRATEEAKAHAESQITDLQDQLEAKDREVTSLRNQLTVAQANHEDRQSLEASLFAQEKAALETRLQEARASHSELETLHRETIEKLRGVEAELQRAEDELACQLANGAAHSEAEDGLRQEIAQVKEEHAKEIRDLEEQINGLNADIETLAHLHREAESSREGLEEELVQTKEQLASRLVEAGQSHDAADRLEAELAQAKESYEERIRDLNGQFDALRDELEEARRQKEDVKAQHERVMEDLGAQETATCEAQEKVKALEDRLVELKQTYEDDVHNLRSRLEDASRALEDATASANAQQHDAIGELTRTIEGLQDRVTALTREADECRSELDEERAAHARIRESTTAEMRGIMAMRDEAEVALTEAETELPSLRAQLEHAESSLREVEEERLSLQYQATNLEAEVQRAKSLERFLESQAAERYVIRLVPL